jgi:hypothetical protein
LVAKTLIKEIGLDSSAMAQDALDRVRRPFAPALEVA